MVIWKMVPHYDFCLDFHIANRFVHIFKVFELWFRFPLLSSVVWIFTVYFIIFFFYVFVIGLLHILSFLNLSFICIKIIFINMRLFSICVVFWCHLYSYISYSMFSFLCFCFVLHANFFCYLQYINIFLKWLLKDL